MGAIIYSLCALTSLLCAVLLFRSYASFRHRILLWSGLSFSILFINNGLVVIDKVLVPTVDLSIWRLVCALVALMPLLYGLIWEED
ncbi:DUF5985 family protein [Noviherbaspirillum sp. CPCC 100848]|uniref:DUF5985 family protein n=1 Tax=Noviherbaspirillum album TaxID=3080276 RepID=A0ABU6JJE0_9BURK|nr:DUF5985 family protein [Noviherbaspirillum sp. CPCC 100848]MEC4723164.1 DUF5985 family protein [Noviherbaspirillum sp. CPCC 100848]